MFGGFGPIIAGIVFFILGCTIPNFSLTGQQVFLAIVSIYLLAFIHAGVSVFNQIEHWPLAKSTLCHFACLYVAYSICYLVNNWIPFDPVVFAIFTGVLIFLLKRCGGKKHARARCFRIRNRAICFFSCSDSSYIDFFPDLTTMSASISLQSCMSVTAL